jgi:hypothetical protein
MTDRILAHQLGKKGGAWLGAARSYLQWHVPGGDQVTWGSEQSVHITIRQIEQMASEIAAAAINEDRQEQAREALRANLPPVRF